MWFKNLLQTTVKNIDLLVLVICLTTIFGVWSWGVKQDKTSQTYLEENRDIFHQKMDLYLEHMFDYVSSIKGFVENSQDFDGEKISNFAKTALGDDIYPSVLRFVYVEAVQNEDIKKFEKEFAAEYEKPDYTTEINPKYSTQYMERYTLNNRGELVVPSGVNLRLSEDRKHFLDRIDQKQSKVLILTDEVRNIKEYSGKSLLLAQPIIVENNVKGLVGVVISIEALNKEIQSWIHSGIGWKWEWDGEIVDKGGPDVFIHPIEETSELTVHDNLIWKFYTKIEKKYNDYWNYVLGVGILMSFVVYGMVFAMNLSSVKVRELAANMTRDLAKYKRALDSSNNHIILTDPEGRVIYANDSVTRMTGFSREEVIGQTPRLWGKQMPSEFYTKFWNTIKNERKVFRGEVKNKRKDGSTYYAEAIVSPIIENDELLGFVGTETDVTNRKKEEEEKLQHIKEVEQLNDLMIDRELRMVELKKMLAHKEKLEKVSNENG